ncbi:MAG: flagellar basal-body MS-ring/collar protein FliF [Rhodocyclaceae bacterium]
MAEPSALPLTIRGFVQLPPRQKLAALAVLALAIGLIAGSLLWARTPNYAVLFSNLSDKDGGAIIAALQQQNVPYRFSEGGGVILVPADQVHDARLRLASQGLPRGGAVGFELMDTQKLGISQFQEQLNYQRGLEGELARSIQSLAAVQGARVHLAIPKTSGFLRDEQQPSASVLVNLRAGRSLEAQQVAGIIHLVAASVPHLATGAVSVIDQNGTLLSPAGDAQRSAGLDPGQLKYVQEIERSYVKRIEDILAPITGPNNLRARVSADVDFSLSEQTAETYRPNQGAAEPSVRSQQTSETTSRDLAAAGVPGALTNQPPVPATAPITTPAAGAAAAASATAALTGRREATINYELDKTIRHTRQAAGTVKRLSVAVVVNHRRITGADGKTVTKPFSEAELKQIQDLTKEAMGYNKERGDTLSVANSPFSTAEAQAVPEVPLWENPRILELAKDTGRGLAVGALALWLFLGVLRPMMRALGARATAEPQAESGAGNEAAALGGPGAAAGLAYDQKLASARELARQDPRLVANVIKEWVEGNERGKR